MPAKTKTTASAPAATGRPRVSVRMYRQGLGDCFLLTFSRESGAPYRMLIDCGVVLGTSDPTTIMKQVVSDIATVTGGHIDLLVATHQHWDHLSGFTQAAAEFDGLTIGQVWLAWTEDPTDPLADKVMPVLRRDPAFAGGGAPGLPAPSTEKERLFAPA